MVLFLLLAFFSRAFALERSASLYAFRVRQLVAKVHTTPLNGRAPNAVYGRSDAPRCSFRSKAKVNCFLHPKGKGGKNKAEEAIGDRIKSGVMDIQTKNNEQGTKNKE